ncbi:MAG: polysaccharide deacetylase family protein [Phenylobacterium sp.]|nr:polysaccharide deacetylase family protein [Phenylobacterium sp.]MCA6303768.1 polysaccharide deacetylase family protein [Phenylobacterium sp.]MCA6312173.1 polysaccharide deacetylase family protein [Phenylobacterium sp.]
MPLPEEHLIYPHRRRGMDQSLYDWRPATARPRGRWPGDREMAIMIVMPVEWHMLDPSGKPFKHPGAMQTAWPDLRHYTTRDYGPRVGGFRLLRALKEAGLKATVPVNGIALERYRPLVEAALEDGHEIAAHGWSTDAIHHSGLSEGEERALVARAREAFERVGLKPRTWMSPARQQSFRTLSLIAEAGFDVCLDWEQDEVPVVMTTDAGMVHAVPLMNELDDRTLLIDRRQTEDAWIDQVLEAATYLKADAGTEDRRVLGFTLTSYVAGQPFRMSAVRRMLAGLAEVRAWSATASEIAAA